MQSRLDSNNLRTVVPRRCPMGTLPPFLFFFFGVPLRLRHSKDNERKRIRFLRPTRR